MTETEFFTCHRPAKLNETYAGKKIIDIFRSELKKYPGAKIIDSGIDYIFGCQLNLSWRNRMFQKQVGKINPSAKAISIENLNPWEVVDCNRIGSFSEALPDTCYAEGCTKCHGHGHLECSRCHGTGREECTECYGHEPHKCPDCGGKGAVWQECCSCDGSGRISCSRCHGKGSVDCPDCNGSGRKYIYGSGYHTCSNCKGLGQITCPSCSGNGSKVCSDCGGRGGKSYECGKCNGTGELHHCAKCHDKGTVVCHVCKGRQKLNCDRCGASGQLIWVYHLVQQEVQKNIRRFLNLEGRSFEGNCIYNDKWWAKCPKMAFDVSDGINIVADKIPEPVRLCVMKMWQSVFFDKKFEDYNNTEIVAKDELKKIIPCEKMGEWTSRLFDGKLEVVKMAAGAHINIKWKGKESTLSCTPLKRIITEQWMLDERKSIVAQSEKRNKILTAMTSILALSGLAYLIGVYCDWFSQPVVKHYLSMGIGQCLAFAKHFWSIGNEYCLTLQIRFSKTFPGVYNFWNWPAVMSLFVLASVGHILSDCDINTIIRRILLGFGWLSAIILFVALPFMNGISWYLAVFVDVAAFILSGILYDKNFDNVRGGILAFTICTYVSAIAYVICHFFL